MSWLLWLGVATIALILVAKLRGFMIRSSHRKERETVGLPQATDRFEAVPRSDKKVRYKCGHDGWKDYFGHFYGEELEPKKDILKSREKCPECQITELKEVTRRCALCGLPIMPGSAVALYAGPASSFTKDWTTEVDGQAMGCVRWGCCPSGGFIAGHWMGDGFYPAFGAGSAAAEALSTGKMVVVGDTMDPSSISTSDLSDIDEDDD